jgi:hypothetical protein
VKSETYQAKLNELLGIAPEVAEKVKQKVEAKKGNIIGITEDEITERRKMEGLVYFLQAPELFHPRVCKRCGEPFLVSRLHVAYCSYLCIRNDMREKWAIEWRNGSSDMELMVKEVYEGNEPLWVGDLQTLQNVLTRVTEALNLNVSSELLQKSLPVNESQPEEFSSLNSPPTPLTKIPIPKGH